MTGRGRSLARGLGATVLGIVVFIVLWQLIVIVGNYPKYILPGPFVVVDRFITAWTDGTMAPEVAATLREIVLGFAFGAGFGLIAGYALARSRVIGLVLSPYLVAAQSTPILALAPLLILWFGPGLLSKVVICSLIVFFPVAVATAVGFRSVDSRLLELGRSLRATRRQVLLTLEVPAAMPSIMGGIRVGVTLAVVGAVVAEWVSPESGLGVLINLARGSLFDIPLMFAALLMLALLGLALYGLAVVVERWLVGDRG